MRQAYRHASGRLESSGEQFVIEAIKNEFAASGFKFKSLITALIVSDGFRYLTPPTP